MVFILYHRILVNTKIINLTVVPTPFFVHYKYLLNISITAIFRIFRQLKRIYYSKSQIQYLIIIFILKNEGKCKFHNIMKISNSTEYIREIRN